MTVEISFDLGAGGMMEVRIGSVVFAGPPLILSISVFETQGKIHETLAIQDALREPITLLSAHDLNKLEAQTQPAIQAQIVAFRQRGGIVLIDSGGYEASRIGRYAAGYRGAWSIDTYKGALNDIEFDLAASFDQFIDEGESVSDFSLRLVDYFGFENSFVPREKLVPVIHLHDFAGRAIGTIDDIVDLVSRVATELSPPFVAIPERELGDGLPKKFAVAKAICDNLSKRAGGAKLHILGCGNPLSFAVFSHAGVGMTDGLEWCRTLVGPDFHLHHFQQSDLFAEPKSDIYNSAVEVIRESAKGHYLAHTLTRNLHALQYFQRLVWDARINGSLPDLICENFGYLAADVVR